MKHLLRVGQIFTCSKFSQLNYVLKTRLPNQPPELDKTRMAFDHTHKVTCPWIEKGQNGWERKHETVIDRLVDDADKIGQLQFQVLETRMQGGGTGHGPHDVFPDGWHVVAREITQDGSKGRLVRFYQTGCFVGMIEPKDLDFRGGPADEEVPDRDGHPKSVWTTG